MALTPELLEANSNPLPRMNDSDGRVFWISPDHRPKDPDFAVRIKDSSQDGPGHPKCLDCPSPSYSDVGARGRFKGTAKLDVEINSEGFPVEIAVLEGLPCGLTGKAVEAIAGWRFKPAIGPDGNPLSSVVAIEVSFHLY